MKNSEPPYMGPLIPDADLINVCIDMARVLMHRNCELEARLAALEQPADPAEPAPALAGVAEPQPVETSARIFREFQQTVDRLLSSPARRRNAQEVGSAVTRRRWTLPARMKSPTSGKSTASPS
jgi:hypothetical protein